VKSHTDYLVMNVPARRGLVNITREVERRVRRPEAGFNPLDLG